MNNATGPVLYAGDCHGRFRHILNAADELRASAVVLLGDMEPARPLADEMAAIKVPWYFIAGNHDADSVEVAERVWDPKTAHRNVHGRVVELPGGTLLAGLAGVFRGVVWYPSDSQARETEVHFRSREEHANSTPRQDRWRGCTQVKHWATIYPDEVDRLANMRADVLVSHESPGYRGASGFGILDTLAQSMGVKFTVNGHHHDKWDVQAGDGRHMYRCHSVGLRGITAIDADGNATVIVPGELDERRSFRQQHMNVFKDVEP